MKFSVSSSLFSARLQSLNRILANRPTITILENILCEVHGEALTMTSSDGENYIITTLKISDVEGSGVFTVRGVNFASVIKEISDQPILVSVNEETYEIEINYQNGKCTYAGCSGDEYPSPMDIEGDADQIIIDSSSLLGGISKAMFAIAEDELRPVMNGIYIDVNTDSTTFVASDGHKLVRDRFVTAHTDTPKSFILPRKPAKVMKDLLAKENGDTIITFDSKRAIFKTEEYTLNCRLIEGNYPNYNSVIPQDNPYAATIDRLGFISTLRRVTPFASSSTSLVRLNFDHCDLTVSAQDIDFSASAEEHIICDYTGAPINIGFKGTFLIDILNSITSEEIIMQLADPSRAGVIVPAHIQEGEDLVMILMPMMLND